MERKKRIVSEETRKKISLKNKGRIKEPLELALLQEACGRSVNQYTLDNHFLHTFECMSDVQKELGICKSGVYNCCRGRQKTAGGYIWRYFDEVETNAE